MAAVIDEVKMSFVDYRYLILLVMCLLTGVIACKNKRKSIIVPEIILTIAILNPVLYRYWYRFSTWGYWRLLWALPIVPVCAVVFAFVIDKVNKGLVRLLLIILIATLIITTGTFVYDHGNTTFIEANNPDKLPDDVVEVAEELLKLDNYPYVVTDASLSQYLRQYSGKIKSLYARDVVFNGPNSKLAGDVYSNLSSIEGDLKFVAESMLNNDYEYLVTKNESREEELEQAGFVFLQQVNGYGIYRVTGRRKEIRTYNDRHQVMSITTVDEAGKAINNDAGYATVRFGYDADGQITSEETYNKDEELTEIKGCSRKEYRYIHPSLTPFEYYYDAIGTKLHIGSGNLHDYLEWLKNKEDIAIFIAVKDNAAISVTNSIMRDMNNLGLREELRGGWWYSYCAIIFDKRVVAEKKASEVVEFTGEIEGVPYTISSAGFYLGNSSSIMIDGMEYSKNRRGLNIVVYDFKNKEVIDSVTFDTCVEAFTETR